MKYSTSFIALATALAVAGAWAQSPDASKIKPIDPERTAKAFKRGQFISESTEIGLDGQTIKDKETVCMDDSAAAMLPMGVLMGVAGCKPQSTSDEPHSIAVTAICIQDSRHGPNFYEASLRWTADGQTIESQSSRKALDNGKPTDKILASHHYKLTYQGASCK